MGVFEMVVIIVAIGCLTGVVSTYFESKAKAAKHGGGEAVRSELAAMKSRLDASTAEVAKLQERVRVLEKLVTDDDHRLAREINQLGARDSAEAR